MSVDHYTYHHGAGFAEWRLSKMQRLPLPVREIYSVLLQDVPGSRIPTRHIDDTKAKAVARQILVTGQDMDEARREIKQLHNGLKEMTREIEEMRVLMQQEQALESESFLESV